MVPGFSQGARGSESRVGYWGLHRRSDFRYANTASSPSSGERFPLVKWRPVQVQKHPERRRFTCSDKRVERCRRKREIEKAAHHDAHMTCGVVIECAEIVSEEIDVRS